MFRLFKQIKPVPTPSIRYIRVDTFTNKVLDVADLYIDNKFYRVLAMDYTHIIITELGTNVNQIVLASSYQDFSIYLARLNMQVEINLKINTSLTFERLLSAFSAKYSQVFV